MALRCLLVHAEGVKRNAGKTRPERRSEQSRRLMNEARRRGSGPVSRGARLIEPYADLANQSRDIVYFCQIGSIVKIGKSERVKSRLALHRREAIRHGGEVRVLAAVHGAAAEERAVQAYFAEHALPGEREYFSPAPTLLDYIRWLRKQYYVAVGEEAPDGLPKMVLVVDFTGWCPSAERVESNPFPLLGPFDFGKRVLTGDDYYAPEDLMNPSREALGGIIDLDPCSHPVAQRVIRARRFFQKTDDGLHQPWSEAIWLNPPFSQWDRWAAKLVEELQRGQITRLLAIANIPTLANAYFRPVLSRADLVIVLSRRVQFWGPHVDNGNGTASAWGQALLYFGPDPVRVARIFKHLGVPLTVGKEFMA